MIVRRGCKAYSKALLIYLLIHGHVALAFSWRGQSSVQSSYHSSIAKEGPAVIEPSNSPSQLLRAGKHLQTSYELALNELQELEFEPLCHRTAASQLVNSCHLLEGKDEATILTDSGRKTRDFVDSYAASLAICDLERGRFFIPTECAKFQESALSRLPIQNTAQLHVTSAEIDACLSGLAASDSAWNTWISYRQKALRFCEAAKADNDKAQSVLLFRRLTTIMSKLTHDIESAMEQRMNDFDLRAQLASDRIDNLSPLIGKLQQDLENTGMLSNGLFQGIKDSQVHVDSGLENVLRLQELLQRALQAVTENQAETVAVHEQSLQVMNQQAATGVQLIAETIGAAMTASMALQQQIETSHLQVTNLESRQDKLEQGMQRLIDVSDNLASQYDEHNYLLMQANNITNEILDTLEDTAASATKVGKLFLGNYSLASWWPYIWCPAVSLAMGSYGLPPSMLRNLGLVALGETAGFIISYSPFRFVHAVYQPTANLLGSFIRPQQTSDDDHNSTNLTPQLEIF
ncbi:hypothetical protein GGR50DRAFT_660562 [Xylaria sp. CBS 124048]|nr:hypothetical protein GGR50DRAFT_660562 [Xylaria sp. CBS 124048]